MHDCLTRMSRVALLAVTALLALPPAALAIVGGERASRADHPYFAVVGDGCGGTLVAPRRVVTAAHCFEVIIENMSVSVGPGRVKRRIVRRALHPRYVRWQRRSQREAPPGPADLMLLDLARPVSGVPFLPISRGEPAAGTLVTTVGRGATAPDGSGQGTFRQAQVQVQDPDTCSDQLPDAETITWSLCTRDPRMADPAAKGPFGSACIGDSGGPLIYGGLLVGVVSWGPACGTERDPEIYANVAEGHTFVADTTPIWAPQPIGKPRIRGRAVPGAVVTCHVRWRVKPDKASYDFIVGDFAVETDGKPRYRVRRSDSGERLSCSALGTTAGGSAGTGLAPRVTVGRAPRTRP